MSDSSLIHQQTDTESLRRRYFSGVDRAALQTNLLTSSILRDSNSSDTSILSSVDSEPTEGQTAPTYLYHKVIRKCYFPYTRRTIQLVLSIKIEKFQMFLQICRNIFQFFYLYGKHKLNCPHYGKVMLLITWWKK